jgi:hypothetical protein
LAVPDVHRSIDVSVCLLSLVVPAPRFFNRLEDDRHQVMPVEGRRPLILWMVQLSRSADQIKNPPAMLIRGRQMRQYVSFDFVQQRPR